MDSSELLINSENNITQAGVETEVAGGGISLKEQGRTDYAKNKDVAGEAVTTHKDHPSPAGVGGDTGLPEDTGSKVDGP